MGNLLQLALIMDFWHFLQQGSGVRSTHPAPDGAEKKVNTIEVFVQDPIYQTSH
jgi:hypothetical protein